MIKYEPPLRDLIVEGYRGIGRLHLPELGQVNLFVGKNNAGKSSLLEAIQLGLGKNTAAVAALIYEAIREHTDYTPRFLLGRSRQEADPSEIEAAVSAVESLFFGAFDEPSVQPIRIVDSGGRTVTIHGPRAAQLGSMDLFSEAGNEVFFGPESRLLTVTTSHESQDFALSLFLGNIPIWSRKRGNTLSIPAGGLSSRDIRQLWDRIAVSDEAVRVEEVMRTIWPSFERAISAGDDGRRSVFIKLRDSSRAVPLQSLGDGVQRVFSIALALALAAGGALLVDEVENGLHHSAQLELWESIFRLAEEMRVQVFATTHSWEAVVAFQEAANRSPAQGILYRLEPEKDGKIYAERYTEADVAIAAEQQVEVR